MTVDLLLESNVQERAGDDSSPGGESSASVWFARLLKQQDGTRGILQALVDTIPAGIIVSDAGGNIVLTNEIARHLLGGAATGTAYGPKGSYTLHRPDGSAFPAEELPLPMAIDRGRSTRDVEILVRYERGGSRVISAAGRPVRDTEGRLLGAMAVMEDVTDRRRVAEERERLLEALRRERDTIEVLMENTEAHLAYLDANLDFVMVNSTYAVGSGHTKEELIGRNHFELFPNPQNQAIFEKVRDTGDAVRFEEKPFEFVDQPWRRVTYWDWTLAPVKDESGRVRGVVLSLVDVTRKVRLRQLSESLNSINFTLSSTMDFEEIMRRVTRESIKAVGCESDAIFLLQDGRWVVRYAEGLPQGLVGQEFGYEEIALPYMAISQKKTMISQDVMKDERLNRALAERFKVRSALTAPLMLKEEGIGVINFYYHQEPVPFEDYQVDFAEKLAASVSLAIQNAQLFEGQRRIAETLQESLVHPVPKIEGLEIGVAYRSAVEAEKVGGDFYDVFELDEGLVGVLIGDVAGKGVEAAGLTETVRSAVRTLAIMNASPAFVLERVNRPLLREMAPGQFVTAAFAVIDLRVKEILLSNAGHPPAIVCVKGEKTCSGIGPAGDLPLGLFEGAYGESRLRFEEGASIILFTDGLSEVRRGQEFFGEDRVLEVVSSQKTEGIQELVDGLVKSAGEFSGERFTDDLAVVGLRLASRK
ncbi:MAG: PAS domain S-box protein [Actinobacteria bacterium]|nr:MAG: PAS domain S-box protein [Actinomycetota bacterium]